MKSVLFLWNIQSNANANFSVFSNIALGNGLPLLKGSYHLGKLLVNERWMVFDHKKTYGKFLKKNISPSSIDMSLEKLSLPFLIGLKANAFL